MSTVDFRIHGITSLRVEPTQEFHARPGGGRPFASRELLIRSTDTTGRPLEWRFVLFADGIDGAAALALPDELDALCADCATPPWAGEPYPALPAAPAALDAHERCATCGHWGDCSRPCETCARPPQVPAGWDRV